MMNFLGVPEYMVKVLNPPPAKSNAEAQGIPHSTEETPTAVKAAADDLLKILKSSKQQPSVAMGGKQVSLLNSIHKLLTAYASGNQASIKSIESPKPSSVSNSRQSSLTDLLKVNETGKGSSNEQVNKETLNDGEHSIKVLSHNMESGSGKESPDLELSATEHKVDNQETASEVPSGDKVNPPEIMTTCQKLVSKTKVSEL